MAASYTLRYEQWQLLIIHYYILIEFLIFDFLLLTFYFSRLTLNKTNFVFLKPYIDSD
jgi:hypothetical protein